MSCRQIIMVPCRKKQGTADKNIKKQCTYFLEGYDNEDN